MTIATALTDDPDTNLLGPFSSMDANVEPLRICKTVYQTAPFFGIFLERDLTPVEAWTRPCDAIVNRGLEVDCHPIIN